MIARATLVLVALAQLLSPLRAAADEAGSSPREATRHFQRGVTLYGEADYRGALVEFNRAYVLAPNTAVLYNIGETSYQLRDYAGALETFERYLATSGPSDAHRAELESSVSELRHRIGHLTVVTAPSGAEISIDDRGVGKTPFEKPVMVNIGHLKVSASIPGRPPATTYVDVAAEDKLSVALELPEASLVAGQASTASAFDVAKVVTLDRTDQGSRPSGSSWRMVGWIATGTLAAGALTLALVARNESKDLKAARNQFPASSATLSHKANLTTTFAVFADSAAAAALVIGGLTLYSSWEARGSTRSTRVSVGLASLDLTVTF
jgi:tetratricopeptide (TPR) repeat protein